MDQSFTVCWTAGKRLWPSNDCGRRTGIRNRNRTGSEDLDGLVESILRYGIIQNPVVYRDGHRYTLLEGHRRVAALREIQRMMSK